MVKLPSELIEEVTAYINGDTSDVAIALLEDVTDTLNDLANGVDTAEIDKLKAENEDLRKRYIARFNGEDKPKENEEDEETAEESTDYEDLFE